MPELPGLAISAVEKCRKAFGLGMLPILCSSMVRGPVVIGIWRPRVLLPIDFIRSNSRNEWLTVLSHEAAHVARKDFAANLVCELLSLPVSFHPLFWTMRSKLITEREIACDELATSRCIEPEAYVRSLLALAASNWRAPKHALSHGLGIFDENSLEERVMKLIENNPIRMRWSRLRFAIAMASLCACALATAFAVKVDRTGNADQEQIYRMGPGITPPRAISAPDPEYPTAARDAKKQGVVVLECVIAADGSVRDAHVTRSLSPELDESALAAIRNWRFEPATKSGKPVAVQISIETSFRLK